MYFPDRRELSAGMGVNYSITLSLGQQTQTTGVRADMSPPDTNVEKQTKRHKGPLAGIPLAIAIAAVVFVAFLAWSAFTGTDTSGAQGTETSATAASDG